MTYTSNGNQRYETIELQPLTVYLNDEHLRIVSGTELTDTAGLKFQVLETKSISPTLTRVSLLPPEVCNAN